MGKFIYSIDVVIKVRQGLSFLFVLFFINLWALEFFAEIKTLQSRVLFVDILNHVSFIK